MADQSAGLLVTISMQVDTYNGIHLAPLAKTVALGKQILDSHADRTVAAIRKAMGQ